MGNLHLIFLPYICCVCIYLLAAYLLEFLAIGVFYIGFYKQCSHDNTIIINLWPPPRLLVLAGSLYWRLTNCYEDWTGHAVSYIFCNNTIAGNVGNSMLGFSLCLLICPWGYCIYSVCHCAFMSQILLFDLIWICLFILGNTTHIAVQFSHFIWLNKFVWELSYIIIYC